MCHIGMHGYIIEWMNEKSKLYHDARGFWDDTFFVKLFWEIEHFHNFFYKQCNILDYNFFQYHILTFDTIFKGDQSVCLIRMEFWFVNSEPV